VAKSFAVTHGLLRTLSKDAKHFYFTGFFFILQKGWRHSYGPKQKDLVTCLNKVA
jgi:hypothetical protein